MDDNVLQSQKLLKYINEFWICFNKEDREEMLKILTKALDRAENIINKYK